MIYFVILFALVIINILDNNENTKLKKIENSLFWIISFIIFFIAAFRNGIGYDFNSYKDIHNEIYSLGYGISESGVELGYYILNKIFSSFAVVIFISAILCVVLKIAVIKKYSENKWTSLIVYFTGTWIMFDLGVIRQGIAMSFALISIKYILDRNIKKFILCILGGIIFHVSIIFFIPLYFIGNLKIEKKYIYIMAIGSLLFSFINIREVIDNLTWILPEFISVKIKYYLALENTSLTISLVKRIIFLIIFVEAYDRLKIEDEKSNLFLNGYILSIIVMGVGSSIDIIGGRGSNYLYMLQIFIFAIIINRLPSKKLKNLALTVVVALSINSMLGIIKHGNSSNQPYTPYRTIFQLPYS